MAVDHLMHQAIPMDETGYKPLALVKPCQYAVRQRVKRVGIYATPEDSNPVLRVRIKNGRPAQCINYKGAVIGLAFSDGAGKFVLEDPRQALVLEMLRAARTYPMPMRMAQQSSDWNNVT